MQEGIRGIFPERAKLTKAVLSGRNYPYDYSNLRKARKVLLNYGGIVLLNIQKNWGNDLGVFDLYEKIKPDTRDLRIIRVVDEEKSK